MYVIQSKKHVEKMISDSYKKQVFLFKHSDSCAISGAAMQVVVAAYKKHDDLPSAYLLIVQHHPELKIELAEDLKVEHQSPQIITIKDGKAAQVANHYDITEDWLLGQRSH